MNLACIPNVCDLLKNYNLEKLKKITLNDDHVIKQMLPTIRKSSLIKFSTCRFMRVSEQM